MTGLVVVLLVLAVSLWPQGKQLWPRAPGSWFGSGMLRSAHAVWSHQLRLGRVRRGWVAEFAELSAVGLEAGLPATEAARLACDVGGSAASRGEFAKLGELVADAQARGGSVGKCLRRAAEGDRDLAFLAAAWQLTDEFGVATAPAARASARVLRERARSDDRRTVLVAGPRASMWLLTVLPLSGPLVALLLGLPVTDVYGSGASLIAASFGLCLTALGWFWSRTVLRRALRPAEIS